MTRSVDARTLKAWLSGPGELALLDVREHGQYGEAHLFHAVPLPYSRLEIELGHLVPRKSARIVFYDETGGTAAALAARRATQAGYTDVHVLAGGAQGWKACGYGLFAGVNVPSKTFGELAEHAFGTPRISATELQGMMSRGENLVVIDGRPFSEYQKMSIPGALCCPNGELALRIGAIAPDPQTTIVVNCAGRTRSIIGAQTLINFGVPNPVYALENGTQGWFLAGYTLEHGAGRRYPAAPPGAELERLSERGAELMRRYDLPQVGAEEAARWFADESRTTYLFDIRTAEEYAAGHLPGAVHAPGGQLVQATDQWVGVRGARLVLVDDECLRAPLMALWLRQLGHDAYVLAAGVQAKLSAPEVPDTLAGLPVLATVQPLAVAAGGAILDLRPGMSYRKAHAEASVWSSRPRLAELGIMADRPLYLIADEPALARAAALDLREAGISEMALVEGGFPAWQAAGLGVAASPGVPADADCIDYLFFTHERHSGNAAAARQYLAWETNLIKQLDEQERASFAITHEHIT